MSLSHIFLSPFDIFPSLIWYVAYDLSIYRYYQNIVKELEPRKVKIGLHFSVKVVKTEIEY